MIIVATACALLCGFLAAFTIAEEVHKRVARRLLIRKQKRAAAEYIPFMRENERKIIAYLLAHRHTGSHR